MNVIPYASLPWVPSKTVTISAASIGYIPKELPHETTVFMTWARTSRACGGLQPLFAAKA